jgi:hypothetical protein
MDKKQERRKSLMIFESLKTRLSFRIMPCYINHPPEAKVDFRMALSIPSITQISSRGKKGRKKR